MSFWTKMVAKLPKLLPRRREVQEEEPAPGKLTDLDKILGEEIQRKQAQERAAAASRDPNMPKYQFCDCRRPSKRTQKAQVGGKDGAFYKCPIHGEFFVER